MKFDKTDLKIVVGIVAVGLVFRWLLKPSKTEKKSSFLGSPFGKRVMFTLTNPTDQVQVVPLFNAYSNTQNPKVGIMPSISEFNRTLAGEPKIIKMIEVRATGNQAQAQKPIQIYCKDASGEMKSTNLFPMVSVYQKALDMTSVQPQNFVIDGQCYLNYTLDPKQTVVLIFHYDLVAQPKAINNNITSIDAPTQKPMEVDNSSVGNSTVIPVQKTTAPQPLSPIQPQSPKKLGDWGKRILIGAGLIGGYLIIKNVSQAKAIA